MNTLNRQIQKGEEVVIKQKLMNAENQELERRVFIAEGGFGMQAFTMGTAIVGHYLCDGEPARIEGTDLDPEGTGQWQATRDEERRLDALAADREAHDDQ